MQGLCYDYSEAFRKIWVDKKAMKFTHKVFHLDKDVQRNDLYNAMNLYMSQYSKELNSNTVSISNKEELDIFCLSNPKINFYTNGYEFDNEVGWRYGELGIWASNISAYKNFLKTDSDYLILMEDDIVYREGFFENLVLYLKQLPESWDVFFYYRPKNSITPDIDSEYKDVCKAYQDWSCLCYVINRVTAKRILDDVELNPITLPIDYYFLKQNKYDCYTVKPDSKLYCEIADMESTFQTKQQRKVLA